MEIVCSHCNRCKQERLRNNTDTAFVFFCRTGKSRSTFAMAVAGLIMCHMKVRGIFSCGTEIHLTRQMTKFWSRRRKHLQMKILLLLKFWEMPLKEWKPLERKKMLLTSIFFFFPHNVFLFIRLHLQGCQSQNLLAKS